MAGAGHAGCRTGADSSAAVEGASPVGKAGGTHGQAPSIAAVGTGCKGTSGVVSVTFSSFYRL